MIPILMWLIFKWRSSFIRSLGLLGLITVSMIFRNGFGFSAHWGRSVVVYFSNFAMGIVVCWLYLKHTKWFKSCNLLYDVVGLLATFGLFYFYKSQHEMGNQVFFNISIALVMITAFKGNIFNWFYTRPVIYIIGGMCYSIYLIHYALIHLSMKLTKFLMVGTRSYPQNLMVQIITNLTLVLIFSVGFFVFIEKPTMDKEWPKKLRRFLNSKFSNTAPKV